MNPRAWTEALTACPDPKRAGPFLDQLRGTAAAPLLKAMKPEPGRVLLTLLSGSQALGELLVAHPDWLPALLTPETLEAPRPLASLRKELRSRLEGRPAEGEPEAPLARIRRFKQKETLRIALRDLGRFAHAAVITRELSDLADVCLDAVYERCRIDLEERLGQPWHRDSGGRWMRTPFCVLGMGKLGGQELNYSSDVDVLFVYGEEGHVFRTPPRTSDEGRGQTNHQFFKRLAEAFVAEVGRMTAEGMLYRIDLRLRPEGNAGPLARSLGGYEGYYWQWGQTWERMMLIKARRVAGDGDLAGEFLELIQPFRYPRSLSRRAVDEIAAMKARIELEVVRSGELDRNVKLGRGGIREIEFIAQSLQMLHAGQQPFLANPQTLPTLAKLEQYHLLRDGEAEALSTAYLFLRDVEHRLQMENNLQTHTIPNEREKRERLARLMGFAALGEFERALDAHRGRVRELYERLFQADEPEAAPSLPPFEDRETEWKQLLAEHALRDPEQALRLVRAFVLGPGFGHVSSRTEDHARQLLTRFLSLCPRPASLPADHARRFPDGDPQARRLSDPDRVLARLDTFIGAYGGRALLFETWASNPTLFELLVLLFDRSEFLAETAIRTPDLVDELELSGYLRRSKTAEQTLKDLRLGAADADQRLWLRRYHQTELMRIGLREILGLADFEQNLVELTALADACLQYALEVVMRQRRLRQPPLAIVGLGKLGGGEITYGSDLDVVFIADDKARNLPELQKVAVEVIELLTSPTEQGATFAVDARLRPDGEKGLLVNTVAAHEDYYRNRARLWELQALSRARAIAGSPAVGGAYETLVRGLTDFRRTEDAPVATRDADWRREIAAMRLRIERERTPKGRERLAIKTGAGGLIDAEFLAQTLCLAHGWHEPNTLRALRRAQGEGALPAEPAERLIANYRKLRRVEVILRRWSYEGETELPDDPAPLYRVAVRCGFTNATDFLAAVDRYRAEIRRVYQTVLG